MAYGYTVADVTNLKRTNEKGLDFLLGREERGAIQLAFDHGIDTSITGLAGSVIKEKFDAGLNWLRGTEQDIMTPKQAKQEFGITIEKDTNRIAVERYARTAALNEQFKIKLQQADESFTSIKSIAGYIGASLADPLMFVTALAPITLASKALKTYKFSKTLKWLQTGSYATRVAKSAGTIGLVEGAVGVGLEQFRVRAGQNRDLTGGETAATFGLGLILSSLVAPPVFKNLPSAKSVGRESGEAFVGKGKTEKIQIYETEILHKNNKGLVLYESENLGLETKTIYRHDNSNIQTNKPMDDQTIYSLSVDTDPNQQQISSSLKTSESVRDYKPPSLKTEVDYEVPDLIDISKVEDFSELETIFLGDRSFLGPKNPKEAFKILETLIQENGIEIQNINAIRDFVNIIEDLGMHNFDVYKIIADLDTRNLLRSKDIFKDLNRLVKDFETYARAAKDVENNIIEFTPGATKTTKPKTITNNKNSVLRKQLESKDKNKGDK